MERQWKALPEFSAGTYEAKRKLLMLYPKAEELGRGSMDNLKKKMRGIGEIGVNDRDVLLSLIRIITAELSKLKIHTNRELVEMFLGCLSRKFAASVAQKLSIHQVSATVAAVTGQGGQNSPRNPEDMFDIIEVMEIARLTSIENANPFVEVFAVPRRFQSEPVGTSWIPIGNFGSQYRPNSRKIFHFSNRIPIRTSGNSRFYQFRVQSIPTGTKWNQLEPVGKSQTSAYIVGDHLIIF